MRAAESRSSRRNRPSVIDDAGARHAGSQGERLRQAEREAAAVVQILDRAISKSAVSEIEQRGAEREENRDLPRLAEPLLDEALADGPRERGRNRGDDHDPGDALVSRPDCARAQAVPPGADELAELAPEVRDDRHERADVERHIERLVEVGMRLEIGPVEQPGDQDQVAGGRDRKQLGEALDGAEDEGLPVGEGGGRVADAEDAEQQGDRERDAGRHDDPDALPHCAAS